MAAGVWQVEVKGVLQPYNGFMAIDDFTLVPGPCPDRVSCDFEDGNCLWENIEDSEWLNGEENRYVEEMEGREKRK